MKVSNGTVNSVASQKGHSSFARVKAPLPLVSVELTKEELELKRRSKFEISNDPEDPNLTKYSRTICCSAALRAVSSFRVGAMDVQ